MSRSCTINHRQENNKSSDCCLNNGQKQDQGKLLEKVTADKVKTESEIVPVLQKEEYALYQSALHLHDCEQHDNRCCDCCKRSRQNRWTHRNQSMFGPFSSVVVALH
jgi:hypothetical protein